MRSRCSRSPARPSPTARARALCSRVENDWVGAQTGLLDQLASLLRRATATRCGSTSPRSSVEPVPLELGGWRLVTLDSGADHSTPPRATTSAAPSAGRPARRSASTRSARPTPDAAAALPDPLRPPRAPRARARTRASTRWSPRCAPATSRRSAGCSTPRTRSLRDHYDASMPAVERTVERAQGARRGRRADGRRRLRRPGARALPPGVAAARRRPRSRRRRAPPTRAAALTPRSARRARSPAARAQRAQQRPGDEQTPSDEHAEPGPQVDVDARGLVDLRLAVGQPEDGRASRRRARTTPPMMRRRSNRLAACARSRVPVALLSVVDQSSSGIARAPTRR